MKIGVLPFAAEEEHRHALHQLALRQAALHHRAGGQPQTPGHLRTVLQMHHRRTTVPHTCRLQDRSDCPHALEMRPSWIDPERESLLQQLLSPDEFKQEILGITSFTVRPAFKPDHLDRFQKTNLHFIESVDVVFVFIDHSGGGASATGICSCLYAL